MLAASQPPQKCVSVQSLLNPGLFVLLPHYGCAGVFGRGILHRDAPVSSSGVTVSRPGALFWQNSDRRICLLPARDIPQSPRSVGFGTSDGSNDQGSVHRFLLIRHEMDAFGDFYGYLHTVSKTRCVDQSLIVSYNRSVSGSFNLNILRRYHIDLSSPPIRTVLMPVNCCLHGWITLVLFSDCLILKYRYSVAAVCAF